ncbi:MAG: metallophosphoesterase family protein [Thermomicrobiales bacterium]
MTRLAILSDIHANLQALEAVQRDLDGESIDRVIVAGDSINWGPSSAEVVDIIEREGWEVIRGNNEYYLLDYQTPRAPAAWTPEDFRVLPWLREQLAGERHNIVAAWPDTLSLRFPDAPAIRVVHGSPRSHWEPIHRDTPVSEVAAILAGIDEPYVIAGHTHLPMDRTVEDWRILNPGSVGLPLDGTSDAEYMLLEGDESGWRPTWRRITYDRGPLFETFDRSLLAERCGPIGELIIEEFRDNRIHVYAFVVWRNQHHPGQPFTDELLQEFKQADRWEYTESAYHVNRDVG